jgi:hypothetical protein
MPVQPHLFSDTSEATPEAPAAPPPRPAPPASATTGTLWLQRVSLFILVLFCVYLGAIVTVLPWPWLMDVWDHNNYFQAHPELWAILRLGPVRGIISGLGLLDIWIGISEAIHYRESSRP